MNVPPQSPTPGRAVRTLLRKPAFGFLACLTFAGTTAHADALSLEGVHVIPHVQSTEMQYRRKPDFSLGARVEVFRGDADGVSQVEHSVSGRTIAIRDQASRVAIYVVAATPGERARIEARRQALIAAENAIGFDPGRNPDDLAALQELIRKTNP
jgi:hypothetical protein